MCEIKENLFFSLIIPLKCEGEREGKFFIAHIELLPLMLRCLEGNFETLMLSILYLIYWKIIFPSTIMKWHFLGVSYSEHTPCTYVFSNQKKWEAENWQKRDITWGNEMFASSKAKIIYCHSLDIKMSTTRW